MLKKNKKKQAIDPARREPWPRAESGGSVGKLLPLRERIERTDGRIDGCVAVRADGRGDTDGGGNKPLQAIPCAANLRKWCLLAAVAS